MGITQSCLSRPTVTVHRGHNHDRNVLNRCEEKTFFDISKRQTVANDNFQPGDAKQVQDHFAVQTGQTTFSSKDLADRKQSLIRRIRKIKDDMKLLQNDLQRQIEDADAMDLDLDQSDNANERADRGTPPIFEEANFMEKLGNNEQNAGDREPSTTPPIFASFKEMQDALGPTPQYLPCPSYSPVKQEGFQEVIPGINKSLEDTYALIKEHYPITKTEKMDIFSQKNGDRPEDALYSLMYRFAKQNQKLMLIPDTDIKTDVIAKALVEELGLVIESKRERPNGKVMRDEETFILWMRRVFLPEISKMQRSLHMHW